jgi:branched-chain amino acid transport system permease protein
MSAAPHPATTAGQRQWRLFLALALAIGLAPLLTASRYHLVVLNLIGLNAIVVVGLNLLIGFAGQISLGHAAFYGLGAYCSGVLTVRLGMNPWPALVLGMLLTAFVAALVGWPALKLRGHALVMATLGFSIVVHFLLGELAPLTGGHDGLIGVPPLAVAGWAAGSDRRACWLIGSVLLLVLWLGRNLLASRSGRALRAIRDSEVAAAAVGIDTRAAKVGVFVLSAVLASLAGSLYAHYIGFISPGSFDFHYSIQVVTMTIVGGLGSLWGSLAGAALLTLLSESLHVARQFHLIAYGACLCLVLIFLPEGVGPALSRRWRAMRGGGSS